MVKITKNKFTGKKIARFKILYWGPASSGKTTAVDTLYNMCLEQDKDFNPTHNLVKIDMGFMHNTLNAIPFPLDKEEMGESSKKYWEKLVKKININYEKMDMSSGTTLYFDRGQLQSCKKKNIYYHCHTVTSQKRFQPLMEKAFLGTDGVIFVADSQRSCLQDNIDGLKELKRVADGHLIKKIPILVMLNKRDLDDLISVGEWEEIMKNEGLFLPQTHTLSAWNPITYETIALSGQKQKNIYNIFDELARRCKMYQVYGYGKLVEKKHRFSKSRNLFK